MSKCDTDICSLKISHRTVPPLLLQQTAFITFEKETAEQKIPDV